VSDIIDVPGYHFKFLDVGRREETVLDFGVVGIFFLRREILALIFGSWHSVSDGMRTNGLPLVMNDE